jgi:hypothetical protein
MPLRSSALRFTSRALTTSAERFAFKSSYEESVAQRSRGRLAITVGEAYLATSRTVSFFDAGGAMVGGYVLRTEPEFRCLRAIPDAHRAAALASLQRARPRELSELTCVWRGGGFSTAAFGAFGWPRIVADCVARGRERILGVGFENNANDLYAVAGPELLYEGPSSSEEMPAKVHVYAFTKPRLVVSFTLNFFLQMPRRIFK